MALSCRMNMLHGQQKRYPRFLLPLIFLFARTLSLCQISPPGLDGANTSSWSALGFNQTYAKRWSTVVYLGFETQSNRATYNAFQNKAISVLNQETSYKLSKQWMLALCTSFRNQNIYDEEAPYALSTPGLRREIRWYGRLFYRRQVGKMALACSFRPEYRLFYTPDWQAWPSQKQWRFRFKVQGTWPLNKERNLGFVLANEWLLATQQQGQEEGRTWTPLHFTEDRFTTFLRKHFFEESITADLGCMHQIQHGNQGWTYTFYVSADLIINNPFGLMKKIMSDNTSVGF